MAYVMPERYGAAEASGARHASSMEVAESRAKSLIVRTSVPRALRQASTATAPGLVRRLQDVRK